MSCEVCIGTYDYEPMDGYSSKVFKARKPAKCCECNVVIAVGQQYESAGGWMDRNRYTYRTCLLCVEIRDVFCCGEGFVHTQLWEDMAELAFPELTTATECFRELSTAAKAYVLERWQEWKGLTA